MIIPIPIVVDLQKIDAVIDANYLRPENSIAIKATSATKNRELIQ